MFRIKYRGKSKQFLNLSLPQSVYLLLHRVKLSSPFDRLMTKNLFEIGKFSVIKKLALLYLNDGTDRKSYGKKLPEEIFNFEFPP